MNVFLRKAKELRSVQEPLLLVLGNESCDLDSAISAITLAYFYAKAPPSFLSSLTSNRSDRIVPVLDVPRKLLQVKTEVTFFLRQHNIDLDSVLCLDEIAPSTLQHAHFILVDHHASHYAGRTVQVIDHRPLDPIAAAALPANCSKRIEPVGSCCTLIADMILADRAQHAHQFHDELLALLHPVVVLDTSNFIESAGTARPLDRDVCERIEHIENLKLRQKLYNELQTARANLTGLSASELLQKDMKSADLADGTRLVALPSLRMPLRQFVEMPGASRAILELASEIRCALVVMLFHYAEGDANNMPHQRQIAVIRVLDTDFAVRLEANVLRELQEPNSNLQLTQLILPDQKAEFLNGTFFTQSNLKASRKAVMPIVQRNVNKM